MSARPRPGNSRWMPAAAGGGSNLATRSSSTPTRPVKSHIRREHSATGRRRTTSAVKSRVGSTVSLAMREMARW